MDANSEEKAHDMEDMGAAGVKEITPLRAKLVSMERGVETRAAKRGAATAMEVMETTAIARDVRE